MDTREEFQGLFEVYLPIGIAVAVIIFGAVAFALIRYRRRDDKLPGQRDGLPIVEGLYALGLAGVVVFLIAITYTTLDRVDEVSADPGQEVKVTAFQWGWRFTYADEGVTVVGDDRRPPTLVVPTETTVRFTVTSRDVIHSFWIPEVRFKRDAFPNREDSFDLSFPEGTSTGRCAEFCGLAHGEMTFEVVALAPPEFRDWLRTQRRAGEIQHGPAGEAQVR